jgi:hypothetical protein
MIDVVTLPRIVGDTARTNETADDAPVDDDQPFAAPLFYAMGPHRSLAARRAVSGVDVDVLGPQARRAVVAVAPVGQRCHGGSTVFADEALVLGGSADGSAP